MRMGKLGNWGTIFFSGRWTKVFRALPKQHLRGGGVSLRGGGGLGQIDAKRKTKRKTKTKMTPKSQKPL